MSRLVFLDELCAKGLVVGDNREHVLAQVGYCPHLSHRTNQPVPADREMLPIRAPGNTHPCVARGSYFGS